MSKDIYSVSLLDMMPQSLLDDPFIRAMAKALDPELKAISSEIELCLLYQRIDYLPEKIVDHLAWQLHVDFYEPDLTLQQKRELVKTSIPWHRHKGTKWAVEQVASIIFRNARVTEWFEYGGDPYYFRVVLDWANGHIKLDQLIRVVNATKNERSWLQDVSIEGYANLRLSNYSFINLVPYPFCNITHTVALSGVPLPLQLPLITVAQSSVWEYPSCGTAQTTGQPGKGYFSDLAAISEVQQTNWKYPLSGQAVPADKGYPVASAMQLQIGESVVAWEYDMCGQTIARSDAA